MASWTNLNYQPGHLVSPSTIDSILDNISVLAIHDHSGSAGEGNNTLSVNAKVSSNNINGPASSYTFINSFAPASNASWSTIVYENNSFAYRNVYLANNSPSASSGACVAYLFPFATESGTCTDVTFHICGRLGPDAGCVIMTIDESSASFSSSGGFFTSRSFYNSS